MNRHGFCKALGVIPSIAKKGRKKEKQKASFFRLSLPPGLVLGRPLAWVSGHRHNDLATSGVRHRSLLKACRRTRPLIPTLPFQL